MGNKPLLTAARIQELLAGFHLECPVSLAEQVRVYMEFLNRWNQHVNLTSIQDPADWIATHFAESFYATRFMLSGEGPVLDVGSGAGFPGLAIKLYQTDFKVILLEPRQKKAAFLTAVSRELALSGVTVLCKTLEECRSDDFSLPPAVLTMRAVGQIGKMIQDGLQWLKRPGKVLLFSTLKQVQLRADWPALEWQDPLPIPWSRQRCLLIGQKNP